MSAVPKRWHDTAPLPTLDDTSELPYLRVVCRHPTNMTEAPAPGEAGLVLAVLVAGQGLGWMLLGALLTRWL
jgi:hypothetical protein